MVITILAWSPVFLPNSLTVKIKFCCDSAIINPETIELTDHRKIICEIAIQGNGIWGNGYSDKWHSGKIVYFP